jgi:hypothetical protein
VFVLFCCCLFHLHTHKYFFWLCTRAHICKHMRARACTHTYTHMRAQIGIRINTRARTHTHTHTLSHTRTHAHTQTFQLFTHSFFSRITVHSPPPSSPLCSTTLCFASFTTQSYFYFFHVHILWFLSYIITNQPHPTLPHHHNH